MSYKSVRLLNETIHSQMDALRKLLMVSPAKEGIDDASLTAFADAQDRLIELRKLFDELAAKADRPTIDDVVKLSPGDYVATMKPLVGNYHRQLMTAGLLASCLNEDLNANACVLLLVGDGNTIVQTAHDPSKVEAALMVDAILVALDEGTKQVVADGVAETEKQLGIDVPDDPKLERDVEEPT